jgi:hypothetical protein
MALVCVSSVRAAPGASTLAVLAAACWPRPVALLEADPSGGALAVRYRLGRTPGLAGLAAAVRNDTSADVLWSHAQMLPGELPVIVAPESGEVTSRILRDAAPALADWCRNLEDADVIVDVGRLGINDVTWPLCRGADELLVVARPRAEELYPVAHRLRAIANDVRSAGVVLVGDRPHTPAEIAQQLNVNVVGVVADDARAAGVLTFGGSSRGLRRSPLVRSVRTFVDDLFERLALPLPLSGALDTGELPAGELTQGSRRRSAPAPQPPLSERPQSRPDRDRGQGQGQGRDQRQGRPEPSRPSQQARPMPPASSPPPPPTSPSSPRPPSGSPEPPPPPRRPPGPPPPPPTPAGLPPEYVERSRSGGPPPSRADRPPPPGELPDPPGYRFPPAPGRGNRPGGPNGAPRSRPAGAGQWRGDHR